MEGTLNAKSEAAYTKTLKQPISTGIPGLDDILCGGIPPGGVVILEGEPGTGKTTIGMQFLVEGAIKHNEPGIYITFEELPEQIYDDMERFGWNLKDLERRNLLRVICIEPEILLEQMLEPNGLFEYMIKEIGCKRVVMDSISLFRLMSSEQEARTNVYTIRNIMRKHALTSFLLENIPKWKVCIFLSRIISVMVLSGFL